MIIAGVACVLAAPAAQAREPVAAARHVLRVSDQRLSLMRSVMASKWGTRSPVQDRAQERKVLAAARAAARERSLDPASAAAVFAAEIRAAKTVELGWGDHWLLVGFPADEPAREIVETRYVTERDRAALVRALLGVRAS